MKTIRLTGSIAELALLGGVLTVDTQPILSVRYGLKTVRKIMDVAPVYHRIWFL
jgi:hypothetical protein